MTRKLLVLLGGVVCLLVGLISWYKWSIEAKGNSTEITTVVVNNGDSTSQIIKLLESKKLVRSYWAAKLYLKLHPMVFKPGVYYVSTDLTGKEIFTILARGPKDIKITFPEGWRREQYAMRLQKTFPEFDTKKFLLFTATLEGKLFPDTYYLPASPTAQKVTEILIQNFWKKSGLKEDQKEVLILASLVERETNNFNDAPIVAGIIWKRLKNDWPLQIDASVQYAKDSLKCEKTPLSCDYWQPINDTKLESEYNTYTNRGLPPLPISNPGENAIKAALQPIETDYWYYLTDKKGVTHFSKDLRAHQMLVDTLLKS